MIFENKDFLITLTGPSGSGKSTIERLLVNNYNLKRAVSHTTREMRIKERQGVDYYFTSVDMMNLLHAKGKLAEYTEYNGNFYGVMIDELMNSQILVVEPIGLMQIKENMKDKKKIISIYLSVTPETARERMVSRGDKESNISARLEKDELHFKENAGSYDYIIPTDNLKPSQILDVIIDIINGNYEGDKENHE